MKNKLAAKLLFAALLALAVTDCSSTAKQTNINANNSNTNSNAVSAATPAKETAPTTAPDALVSDLYRQHDAKNSPFYQTKDRALVDKYFAKSTADIIWKDAVDSKGEVGALGADPLYNAQDTEIKNFKVNQAEMKGDKAEVPVTFENFGKKQTFTYALVKESGNWKIEDIKYDDGYSLVKILKGDSTNKSQNSSEGNFEGKYQIGDTTCTVKAVKMAFEVKWEKGSGTEMFFSEGEANDKFIFASNPETGKANVFSFDDENYNIGIFYRADGKEFPIKRMK